ncbi:MAG: DUF1565 domain-containing protein [Candidatus Moranbacteria bacterium]|nr:DUF1565 domain-containing protein [Candidatus Moranbacteria bacterium]
MKSVKFFSSISKVFRNNKLSNFKKAALFFLISAIVLVVNAKFSLASACIQELSDTDKAEKIKADPANKDLKSGWVDCGDCKVYVDDDAKGKKDGTKDHPFKSIQKAIDIAKHHDCKNVFIKEGYYKQNNIELWEDIKITSPGRDKVIIDGNDKDEDVIKMYDDTKLQNVTIKGGKNGVEIKGNAKTLIWDSIIKNNKRDGVNIERSEASYEHKVNIHKTKIYNNGWNGIFSEKKRFYLEDNEIYNNGWDGVEFQQGSKGSIKRTTFKDNEGLGLRLTIDKSSITIDDCTFKDNDKSGLEVRRKDQGGYLKIRNETKFYKNDKYGIVRLVEEEIIQNKWDDSVKINSDTKFWDNDYGDISHLIEV